MKNKAGNVSNDATTALPDEPEAPAPIRSSERFQSMDTLRGVAVLGILVMNIYAFAMPFAAYSNPLAMGGTDPLNMGTWFVTHILFDQKFLSIFAMLYGAGMVMMTDRAEAKGAKITRVFYRRSFWLLVIGILHGYLIWVGDILFAYAAIGMLMFLLRKRSPTTLIVIGVLMLPMANVLGALGGAYTIELRDQAIELEARQAAGDELTDSELAKIKEWNLSAAFMAPDAEDIQRDIDAYRGTYADALEYRIPVIAMLQTQGTFFYLLWRAGGLMLIGMALMKLGVLKAQRSSRFYRNMMLLGYGIGLPIMAFSAIDLYNHDFDGLYAFKTGMISNYWGSIFVALGHVGLVMSLVRAGALVALQKRFAAVGRMAFTNYLMHSLVMTTIFYGHGFNLYTEVPRFYQMGFVVALIGLQLLYSPWWLQRFRFGPAEWLWRSMTYWRLQPMRQPAGQGAG